MWQIHAEINEYPENITGLKVVVELKAPNFEAAYALAKATLEGYTIYSVEELEP